MPFPDSSDFQFLGPFIIAGGVNNLINSIAIKEDESPSSLNFVHSGGELSQRPSSSSLTDMTSLNRSNRWTGLFQQKFRYDLALLCLASASKFYTWNGSTFTDRSGAVITSASDTFPWNMSSGVDGTLSAEGVVFLVNGANGVLYLSSSAGSPAATLALLTSHGSYTGGPATLASRYVLSRGGRVIFGYTTEAGTVCAQRLRMSTINNFLNFDTTAGAQVVDHADTPGVITGLFNFRGYIYVAKEDALIVGQETGNPRNPFVYPKVFDVGVIEGRSFQPITSKQGIFLGKDNFYLFDGNEPEPIGDKIKKYLFSSLNYNRVRGITSGCDYARNIYRCWIPTGSSDFPTHAFCFNWIEGIWWEEEWPGEVTSYSNISVVSGEIIGTDTTPIGTNDGVIGDWAGSSGSPTPIIGTQVSSGDYRIYRFNTLSADDLSPPYSINPSWQSKDFRLNPPYDSTIYVVVVNYSSSAPATISVGVSTNKGESFVSASLAAAAGIDKQLRFGFESTGQYHRIKIDTSPPNTQTPSSTINPIKITGIELHYNKRGRRQ